ncbi:unnamed protein product [Cuscuta campestris]|uniref:Glycosyltransferase n=1 Tax=Cuscuta campestris TaxID=132261 RepID=A0A484L8X9_9ASTE|nr:unnamed protein product [Cuscuta campestris]
MENPTTLTPPPSPPPPHVLIFPLPIQGPVNTMLKLAEILCLRHIGVTFLNTHHVHRRLLRFTDAGERFAKYSGFRFATVPDGLPEDNPRTGDQIMRLIESMEQVTRPLFREMVVAGGLDRPVTCLLVDGILTFAVDVAEEGGVPLLYFDTISPCGLWSFMCVPKLIEAGELPFQGPDLDSPIRSAPGFDSILRRRDMPSFCRAGDVNDPTIQLVLKEDQHLPKARGLIFNTFDRLDGPIVSHFRAVCPNVYAIGPLHIHLKSRLRSSSTAAPASSNSLWEEDRSCMDWLDMQPHRSVLYVSIGSMAIINRDQLTELWHGLVDSGSRFLWVQRPGSVMGGTDSGHNNNKTNSDGSSDELLARTKEKGFITQWAPQEQVLAHPSVGGFLTHSGWNSTLESMVEGVPMICWPYFVDQQVNSRFVQEVWRVGLDMKDVYERGRIERMIREVMEDRKEEFLKRASEMAKLAQQSVEESGTSYKELDRLIDDIKLMRI